MKEKLTIGLITPWKHPFMLDRTPGGQAIFETDKSFIKYNIDQLPEYCDLMVVWGGLPNNLDQFRVKCPEGRLIYLTEEAHPSRHYSSSFLAQFDQVLACRDDLGHANVIRTHEINTWQMGLSIDQAIQTKHISKTKTISIVCSDLTILPGHKKRFAFANQLRGHFKDRIDFYGTAFQPVANKWDALRDYKYSIAIENCNTPGYFTEKLTECYLAHCLPVYSGAPDICEYFDPVSLFMIDIDDFTGSVIKIEALLEDDPYKHLLPSIIASKHRYLNEYHIFSWLAKYLEYLETIDKPKASRRIIRNERTFIQHYTIKKIASGIKHTLGL